ncbi:hypothetical protein Nepgr_011899 [Nepenthes gracilis]|uniref:Uncharacterized protein n=1 Tax=Nepenthes gracilis TaxID=150966 RepID=A0AAD3SF47_NEPGR|nr:hypothetical protein Nepgr_011899 [Nepenthes gracilis]
MVLLRSLVMLLLLIWPPGVKVQSVGSSTGSARALDSLLQAQAYKALVNPKTGVAYDGTVPSNLTGIKISVVRLRSGSLRMRGVKTYKEFDIPIGIVEQPYVERLALVYQNLGNWSEYYYPLSGYTYLSPVLGLMAYDAANLSATNLPELDIRASMNPISIRFSNVNSVPDGLVAKCLSFDLQGLITFSKVLSNSTCSTIQQGHFALVVEGSAPLQPASGGASPPAAVPPLAVERRGHDNSKVWITVGSVLGGSLLLVLLALLLLWLRKYRHKVAVQWMDKVAEGSETLQMASVGSARAPSAFRTRTLPSLETELVP